MISNDNAIQDVRARHQLDLDSQLKLGKRVHTDELEFESFNVCVCICAHV